jgi:hypothetical protein
MGIKIRKGDQVQVISGNDKGKVGRVLAVDDVKMRVVIEKVNFVKRHTKPRRQGVQLRSTFPTCSSMTPSPSAGRASAFECSATARASASRG